MEENFTIDSTELNAVELPMMPVNKGTVKRGKVQIVNTPVSNELESCLRNTTIEVRYLALPGTVNDTRHVMYGGLAEGAFINITVPRLRSGIFVDVLTKNEKEYLEQIMGLEVGALNVYNKTNNFWDNTTEGGISRVRLSKQNNHLNLNNPIDYIKYKILLANKDLVAPNLQTLQDRPKATYRFVLVADNEVNAVSKAKMSNKAQCYVEYGKYESNEEVLRMVIETLTSKPLANNTKLDFLQTKIGELIDADSKLFLRVIQDPLLKTRILIKKCIEQGFISKRGDFLYLRSDNTPLCEGGEEPTMTVAAKYLNNPKRQDMKLSLEAKLQD